MAAPTPFPRNLWAKALGAPRWTLSLKWSAEISRTRAGWKVKAAMKPFLSLESREPFESKEDAMAGVCRLFEGYAPQPWAPTKVRGRQGTCFHQNLELIRTQDCTWVLTSALDPEYGYEFDTKEEAQMWAEQHWVLRFAEMPREDTQP